MADRTHEFYAAEGAIHGYGFELMVGDTTSPTRFESIAACRVATPGDMSTADIDRTHGRSPNAHKEHMPGMRDSGPFQVEGIWLPTEQSQSNTGGGAGPFVSGGLIAIWRSREIRDFILVIPNSGSPGIDWPFRGYVSQFQPGEIGVDGLIPFTAAFQPTEAYDQNLP